MQSLSFWYRLKLRDLPFASKAQVMWSVLSSVCDVSFADAGSSYVIFLLLVQAQAT